MPGLSRSTTFTTFAQHANIQLESPDSRATSEEWAMSSDVRNHLNAQERHICARITAKTNMNQVSDMVASRSMSPGFQIALGAAVMVEWSYMRIESDGYDTATYERLRAYWDDTYAVCIKYYNAPIEVIERQLSLVRAKYE